MENIPEVTPLKRKKTNLDFRLCIICQKDEPSFEITKTVAVNSLETLILRCNKRAQCKDSKVFEFIDRIKEVTIIDILNNNGFYHRKCYKTYSNLNEVKRAEQRFKDLQGQSSSVPVLKRKVGRPSLNMTSPDTIAEQPMLRRSQSEPYNKKLCVICQKDGGVLHLVQTLQMGANMLSVSERNSDKSFYRRLNSITAATDVSQHLLD